MSSEPSATAASVLGTRWERSSERAARVAAGASFLLVAAVAAALPFGLATLMASLLAVAVGYIVHDLMTAKLRRRRAILGEPFAKEWAAVLEREVLFYRVLDAPGRARFQREVQVFLGEKRVTGIRTEVDTTTRVLVAASAVIPIFGFPEWEWDQISEVLVYPTTFDQDFQIGDGAAHPILGMVGSGMMNRLMILSQPDLIQGFKNSADKHNVGVHEFAHLVDKADGSVDGVPGVALDRGAVGPWLELVRREMQKIEEGESDIRAYGASDPTEFFAVASEYFFERPGLLQRKHPELYRMLARVFDQDLATKVTAMSRARGSGRRLGRNSPCPCGSGQKYKKCCLGQS